MQADKQYNVLLVTAALGVGGLETYLLNVLKALDRKRFVPTVVYEGRGSDTYRQRIEDMGIEVILVPNPYTQLTFMYRIARIIKSSHIDIVCDFRGDFSAPTLLVGKLLGIRSRVAMYRSSEIGFRPSALKDAYAEIMHKIVKHFATGIIGNTRKVLDSFYPDRGEDTRFGVVNNGVEVGRFRKEIDKIAVRESLGISPRQLVIGHLGRLHKSKNHETLLEVFARVHEKLPETHLLLVGDGPLRKQIADKVEALGLGDLVTMAGQRVDVPEMLGAMDVFIFPSIYEGMPNALVEAMVSGLAFVASDIPEISEIVPPELQGQLSGPYDIELLRDKLCEICIDGEKRKIVAGIAQNWATNRYSIQTSVNHLCEEWLKPFDEG